MASLSTDIRAPSAPSRRPRGAPARWWLAGLLVGCLLPAGLAQAEWRPVERVVQMCILAPALIRASSRQLQARRRSRRRWLSRMAPCRPVGQPLPVVCREPLRAVAAHDVLTRRGPPSLLSG
ncbi:hypothetical protein [Halomonas caseinilytica]|uniref:Uncharacterized protein n=1 Tax=Halomonas caseinilytica TaxID=438744 RepID=A0A1M6X8C8_9GAMM|nr:hypothetical protein [Halomonas caseinilytica]SEM73252.1 hypothetical protein SAMN04487952_106167 [Halomonas caseinilytica]SHL02237.1 hypothetical protein SAMN05192556_10770 [Halomonas caseinilytica]